MNRWADIVECKCRLCSEAFCCKECRLVHEVRAHKINVDCEICVYGKLILRDPSQDLLIHIQATHLPLHCHDCLRVFATIGDLVFNGKCKMSSFQNTSDKAESIDEINFASPPILTPYNKNTSIVNSKNFDQKNMASITTSTPMHVDGENGVFTPDDGVQPVKFDIKKAAENKSGCTPSLSEEPNKTEKCLKRKVTFCDTPNTENKKVCENATFENRKQANNIWDKSCKTVSLADSEIQYDTAASDGIKQENLQSINEEISQDESKAAPTDVTVNETLWESAINYSNIEDVNASSSIQKEDIDKELAVLTQINEDEDLNLTIEEILVQLTNESEIQQNMQYFGAYEELSPNIENFVKNQSSPSSQIEDLLANLHDVGGNQFSDSATEKNQKQILNLQKFPDNKEYFGTVPEEVQDFVENQKGACVARENLEEQFNLISTAGNNVTHLPHLAEFPESQQNCSSVTNKLNTEPEIKLSVSSNMATIGENLQNFYPITEDISRQQRCSEGNSEENVQNVMQITLETVEEHERLLAVTQQETGSQYLMQMYQIKKEIEEVPKDSLLQEEAEGSSTWNQIFLKQELQSTTTFEETHHPSNDIDNTASATEDHKNCGGILYSVASYLRNKIHGISVAANCEQSGKKKRVKSEDDSSNSEISPVIKKMKYTQISCRRPIRNVPPHQRCRRPAKKVPTSSKSTQTEPFLINKYAQTE